MNKEEIHALLDKLDLEEWNTSLYKVPLTWCELYDIRDYITNLQQRIDKAIEIIDKMNTVQELLDGEIYPTRYTQIKNILKEKNK